MNFVKKAIVDKAAKSNRLIRKRVTFANTDKLLLGYVFIQNS